MANCIELTLDEAIQQLKELNNMQCTRYSIKDYAPNKIYEIIYNELYDSNVGGVISILYQYNGNLNQTHIKMKDRRWEAAGYLYNRKKGYMSGSYSSENETYQSLKYILDHYNCTVLEIYN